VGADAPVDALDSFPDTALAGSTGEETLSAVARYYEGLNLPAVFGEGKSPYAGERLSSLTDPHLSTGRATLPVATNTVRHF
jgi:hypothetical protein